MEIETQFILKLTREEAAKLKRILLSLDDNHFNVDLNTTGLQGFNEELASLLPWPESKED